jgi:aspartyl protease family protein
MHRRTRKAGNWTLRLAVIAVILTAIVGMAASMAPGGLDDWGVARAIPLGVIIILMVLRLAASTRPLGHMAKQLSVFLALGAVLVVGYSYKDDLQAIFGRTLGTVVPGRGTEVAPGMMRFQADNSGQFVVNATVNGKGVRFLVDTGASGIALSRRDAERLGFDNSKLDFDTPFSTANGMTRGARITLDAIQVGPLTAHGVRAWVNEGDLDQSLLGMSYLSTLGRVEIRGDTLILER